MFQKLCFLIGVVAVSMLPFASGVRATDLSHTIAGLVSDGTASIPYRLFQPQTEAPGQKVPLILFLQGMGDRGTDNVSQTNWMNNLASKTSSGPYAAYVLAPQISTSMWFSTSSNTPTEGMKLTLQALHEAMKNPNVDASRIYVTGLSMGGFGTWDILRREPGTFAAAVPMSGGGDLATAAAIKNTPVWAFHGSADNVVSVDTTRKMVQALTDAGGSPKYTEIAGGGHAIWSDVYADAGNTLYPWLFDQRLGSGIDPTLVTRTPVAAVSFVAPAAQVIAAATPVPEPASLGLLLLGGLSLLARKRR